MFSEIFVKLLQENNISAYRFSTDTEIPQSLISNWKKGIKTPSFENILKIANYFNVSADYLLGRTDVPDNPNLKLENKENEKNKDKDLSSFFTEEMQMKVESLLKEYRERQIEDNVSNS